MLNGSGINWNETENTPSQNGIFRTPPYRVFRIPMTAHFLLSLWSKPKVGNDIQPLNRPSESDTRAASGKPYAHSALIIPGEKRGRAHGR